HTVDLGEVHGRERAERAHDIARGELLTAVRSYGPQPPGLVERQGFDRGVELDVLAQPVAVDDMLQIGEDLPLRGVAGLPLPLAQQLPVEGVAVEDAVDVGGRARVAVPVPGTSDAAGPVEGPCGQ